MANSSVTPCGSVEITQSYSASNILDINLKILNVSSSIISENITNQIANMPGLKKIFVYNTNNDSILIQKLNKKNQLVIIQGNEMVPTLQSDTTIVK